MNKRNDFICIGAVHPDYVEKIKQNYFKNRTNPIVHNENLGGVAYNVAKTLAFLNQKTTLYSLNCSSEHKKEILNNNIKFFPLNKDIKKRYYTSILNKEGKMILGLANMDSYEGFNKFNFSKIFINKIIILDLNLSLKFTNSIINKYYKRNYICILGTSAHKVYKIKKFLHKINTIILNKKESLTLTNKKTVKDSINYLIKKNKKLNIIVTNGQNNIYALINNKLYSSTPPKIKINNENGAGDIFSAFFIYYHINLFDDKISLQKSTYAGALEASGYEEIKEKYLQKLNKISRSIKIKKIKK